MVTKSLGLSPPLLPEALPLPALLKLASEAGVRFRLAGEQLRVTVPSRHDVALVPILATLKDQRDALWQLLGGTDLDQPPRELIASLGVEAIVLQSVEEALALIAEMAADSDTNTPEDVRRTRGGLLGFDIETAANPGADARPAVRLRLRDGHPSRNQPALKNSAALNPHHSTIRLAQLYGGGRRCLVLDTTVVPLDVLTDVLGRRVMVIHNASFELRFLAEAGLAFPRFEDTMQAAGLLLGTHRRSLDEAVNAYLGITLPKGLQRSDFSAPRLSPGQIAYAALDAIVTFRLWLKLRLDLHARQRASAYILQRDVTPAVVRMSRRGITLDRTAHLAQVMEWQAVQTTARQAFTTGAGQPPPVTPNETRELLTRVLPPEAIETWPRTGTNKVLSIKAADLKRHISNPAIRALLAVNAMTKLVSAFGTDLASKVSAKSGRLHPGYNIAATKTGRFSSNNPNIQQIPKTKAKALRRCFVAAPGMRLVIADYNAMELRAAAAISNDAAMNTDFANGVDLHRRQAAETLGIPQGEVSRQQRDAAKPIAFGTIYGAGRRGLAASAWTNYDMVLSEDDAEAARQAFLARYPDLAAWMDRSSAQSNQHGAIVVGRLGRVIEAAWEHQQRVDGRYNWRFADEDDTDDLDEEERPPLPWRSVLKRTLCCNAPVQGACADAAMLALTWIDAALTEAGIIGGPVLFVHDEIVLEVPEAEAERAGAMLIDCMTRAFATTFPNAPVSALVELRIQTAWTA